MKLAFCRSHLATWYSKVVANSTTKETKTKTNNLGDNKMAFTDKFFGGELCANFTIPITETDVELYFHVLLTRDYMSSRSSFAQILSKPELNQSRPQCLPFWWALGSRLGLNGLKPATRLRDVVLGKKTVFGIELTGVRDAGLSWKKSGITGSGSYFQTPFFSKCIRTRFFSIMSFPQRILQSSQEKSKTIVMEKFWGVNKVHYSLCENGERLGKNSQNQFCFSENVKCPI